MKKTAKLLVLMMTLVMALLLAGCGGGSDTTSGSPAEKAEFTAEQVALAQEYAAAAEDFNGIVDRVNAVPELMKEDVLIDAMNELAAALTEADRLFTDPAYLTPEVMDKLKEGIKETRDFVTEAEGLLAAFEDAKG